MKKKSLKHTTFNINSTLESLAVSEVCPGWNDAEEVLDRPSDEFFISGVYCME
jgi:hypothetical protein